MTYSAEYDLSQQQYQSAQVQALPDQALLRPLRNWLYCSLAMAVVLIGREALWKAGLQINQRAMSAVLSLTLIGSLARAGMLAARIRPDVRPAYAFFARTNILIFWALVLAAYGWMRDNYYAVIYRDTCGYIILALWLRLSVYDDVWRILLKPLIFICLLSSVAIFLTSSVPSIHTTAEGSLELKDQAMPRHLETVGFSMLELIAPGFSFLGAMGLIMRKGNRWKFLALLCMLASTLVTVGLFQFRGGVVNLVGILLIFALLTPVLSGRIPLGTLIGVALLFSIGVFLVFQSGVAAEVEHRFGNEQIFGARISEADSFFQDMNPVELMVGRGMGGYYNGPGWAPVPLHDGRRDWSSNHFGILSFVLRGGFAMLLFMGLFVLPGMLPKPRNWLKNEWNLAAIVLAPLLLFGIVINPVTILPDSMFQLMVYAFCFGRFAAPTPAEDTSWMLTQQPAESGY